MIIKAGYEQISETISEILGARVDPEIAANIKKSILWEVNRHETN